MPPTSRINDNKGMAIQTKEDSSVEWFWMLISFVKVHKLRAWRRYNPQAPYEIFEALWPFLLDLSLSEATRATIKNLRERDRLRNN